MPPSLQRAALRLKSQKKEAISTALSAEKSSIFLNKLGGKYTEGLISKDRGISDNVACLKDRMFEMF
jgi:hypothetical protein